MFIPFIIFSILLVILCSTTVYFYVRSSRASSKAGSNKRDTEMLTKSGIATADFDIQKYVLTFSGVFGVSNMGVSMDHREIYVCPLYFEEAHN